MLHTKPDPKLTIKVYRAGQLGAGTQEETERGTLSSSRAHTQERLALKTTQQRRGTHGGFESTWLDDSR